MKCPVCNDVRMREVEKDGVLIDVCPDCKGVWLDRGELEKLMAEVRVARQSYTEWEREREHRAPSQSHDYRHHDSKHHSHYDKHRKKSVFDRLGDLFD